MLPFLFIGILLAFLGIYIWQKEAIWLLSNFSENTTADKKGLARWAGKWFLAMGALSIVTFIGPAVWQNERAEGFFVGIFIVGILTMTILYLIGGQKYVKK